MTIETVPLDAEVLADALDRLEASRSANDRPAARAAPARDRGARAAAHPARTRRLDDSLSRRSAQRIA